MVSHRSTKGASKARRDHINHEIRNMRALLPLSRDDQERMSYLHSMAAVCTFIRKSVLLRGLPAADGSLRPPPYKSFLPALRGFILVTTAQGKLVYVSENVSEYLGFSMLDVLQGDTLYDMLERSDVDVVKSNLDAENDSSTERSFVCRMQTSKAFKLQHGAGCSFLVQGRYLSSSSSSSSSQPLFVSLCTPTVNRQQSSDSLSFHSVHRLDMSFTQVSHSVSYFWGYSAEELIGGSWYGLIHPEDLAVCAAAHRSLAQADEGSQVEMVLRLQCKDLSWTWVYVRANRLPELQGVSCTNFTISQTEARFLQTKISSEAFKPSNSCRLPAQQTPQTQSGSFAKCLKRQRTSESEEQSGSAQRDFVASSPAPSGDALTLFTPPYSPASSSSSSSCSPPQDQLSHDLLMDVHRYTDQLLTCHLSPSEQMPFITSPLSSSSPSFDFPPSDVRLVPDLLSLSDSLSDLCESSPDCALHHDELSLLQQPPGGVLLHQPQVLPLHSGLLTPNQSPASREGDYSEQEQAEISILAQQISSLASSFSSYQSTLRPSHAAACEWTLPPPPPVKREHVLDDCVFESILKDLNMVSVKSSGFLSQQEELLSASSSLQGALLPAETFVDPFGLQLGRSDQNTELHQLNEYMQRVLQQDALAEENLY